MLDAERGLVVARQGNEVIVLTPEGEWRTLHLTGLLPEVGEEVMLPLVKKRPPWQAMMAAAAVILLLFLALPLARRAMAPPTPGQLAFYINIDINPSIELAVDDRERVLSARGLNSDGEKLLAGVALKDEKAAIAIQVLTREAVRQGYYLPDRQGAMVVTVIPAAGAGQEKLAAGDELGQKLTREARNVLQQARVQAVVEAATVQPEIRQHAEATGLSAGKYSILLEALDAGLPVTAADLQKDSLARVLARFDTNWEQLLQKLQQDKDLLQKEQQLGPTLKRALGQQVAGGNSYDNQRGNDRGPREKAENIAGNQDRPGQSSNRNELEVAPGNKGTRVEVFTEKGRSGTPGIPGESLRPGHNQVDRVDSGKGEKKNWEIKSSRKD
ncbi:Anti-sigma factor RsgI, N-terminal [Moorella glycerini]|uniref:Anti-sigma-I factor RsgI n=1 Tax=Neomoorella stamsii TaxID=1266720 RepID=A0A9X7J1N9_9FIRM|nr:MULTISPECIES: anti-sigma factor domain-containing protein [Moorella]PRR71603.1 Anti-sigma-I factor RsgI [Moorella stamsii]CEP66160.1 Anti-sigma factor RsgI, N-terminal [Moorella glycerini]